MARTTIAVEQKPDESGLMVFAVTLADSASSTQHRITLHEDTYRRLTGGRVTPRACVEAAMRFLLERETKDAILPSFDVNVIQLYFSTFERDYANYL